MTIRISWIGGVLVIAALFLGMESFANAFSDRAGSCNAGVPLQGSHLLNEQLGGGGLSDKGFQVRLNGLALDSESKNDMPISVEGHELKLVATAADTFFRGFLVRIDGDGVDTREYLDAPEGDDSVRVVSLCVLVEDVGGVSHTSNSEKTEATAILRLPDVATDLAMDVTMVVQNRDGAAEWYNDRFILNAGAITVAPTGSPAPSPMQTSSQMPTSTPKPEAESAMPTSIFETAQPSELADLPSSSATSYLLTRVAASSIILASVGLTALLLI